MNFNIIIMGRNMKVVCEECMRVMRQDHLKRHMKMHENVKYEESSKMHENVKYEEPSCPTSLNIDQESNLNSITSFETKKTVLNEEAIIKTLKMDDADYENTLELGRMIVEKAKSLGIAEESLRSEYKKAKELYLKHEKNVDIENVILRSWQDSLLQYLKPSNREIIWVIGRKGNEGKTWFQEYMESKYGWAKVICGMDIKLKKSTICHVLSKRSLMSTEIFLFDVGKAFTYDGVNYELLEKIKNGRVLASKFDSKELKFKTPNIVVVFSNEAPEVKQLSKDRWKIFQIRDDDLIDATDKYV